MAQKFKVEMNSSGAKALLADPAVVADLLARGGRIRSAAGDGVEVTMIRGGYGGGRPVVFVATETSEAKRDEAINHSLLGSVDSGR
ncbi:hypothetical protein [Psychromicrobium lacuslunae]|uniref:Uncharacterized protein n=1 Tax=Psychromicrobium lacuslunae TaxID=1618207 RepID=A0A0D4C1E4_9MICC|nr:hypothetical protein [Psychromicrobium lacuslunae]AJT42418.1 hypothetical protein UM93_14595 [Psychromicrobium lacuslunae]